jgi:carbon storage regulator CsrA
MLVLSRKFKQQIRIGDRITVTVLKARGNTVRIGVEAPPHMRIVRGELPMYEGPKTLAAGDPPPREEDRLPLCAARVSAGSPTNRTERRCCPAGQRHPRRWSVANMRLRTGGGQASSCPSKAQASTVK